MGLRERFLSALESWAEGEEVVTDAGEGIYRPPGHRARGLGDTLAGLGTLGLIMPLVAARLPGQQVVPTDAIGFAGYRFAPLVAALPVWMLLLLSRWESRVVIAAIGLVATAFTWQWAVQLVTPGVPGFVTTFLGVGSVLVFVGGTLSTVAMLVGEWAPKNLHDVASE